MESCLWSSLSMGMNRRRSGVLRVAQQVSYFGQRRVPVEELDEASLREELVVLKVEACSGGKERVMSGEVWRGRMSGRRTMRRTGDDHLADTRIRCPGRSRVRSIGHCPGCDPIRTDIQIRSETQTHLTDQAPRPVPFVSRLPLLEVLLRNLACLPPPALDHQLSDLSPLQIVPHHDVLDLRGGVGRPGRAGADERVFRSALVQQVVGDGLVHCFVGRQPRSNVCARRSALRYG